VRPMKTRAIAAALVALAALAGCAAKRPVLYPNQTLQSVGAQAAQEDIDACLRLAHDYGTGGGQAGRAAGQTATHAATGAAAGAVTGAILGAPGTGAAVGAAGAGTVGLMRWLFGSREPDEIEKRFVDHCLRDKGYEPIGWR